jgi:hypothetical protein
MDCQDFLYPKNKMIFRDLFELIGEIWMKLIIPRIILNCRHAAIMV